MSRDSRDQRRGSSAKRPGNTEAWAAESERAPHRGPLLALVEEVRRLRGILLDGGEVER